MPVTAKIAQQMIAAAEKKANEIGVPMVIAVVDQGANLVAQLRQDDALLVSIDLAWNKAYTAVAVKMSTETLGTVSQPGGPLYGIHTAHNGRVVIFGGGLPIEENGTVIGGIGVSGGSVEQDIACAEAGLAAYNQ
ncbi:GlcG/HbpS family heme-binding protein [Maridesulfovibrio zosterae]|uniref:GlcG/HbpS family heme-binding protein n=1 Tax=Maridesulfovibrio zosterae TaxID=82171 RepID=UPI00042841FA|nr:heme-binding protein [Maridesulfovibrio zosterae]